jgi:hypothetical protein
MSTKKTKAAKPRRKEKAESVMPKIIYANASPRSVAGVSMFDAGDRINAETVANFFSDEEIVTRAVNRLRDAGFEILQVSPITINIATLSRAVQCVTRRHSSTARKPRCPASSRQRGARWLI